MSARRTTSGRSRVRRMGDGDGAAFAEQQHAPSACRRCWSGRSTTASRPARSPSSCLQQHQAAERRAGHQRRRGPIARRPALIGWKPSTSLAGSMRGDDTALVDLRWEAAAGRGCRRPRSSALSSLDQREQLGLADRRRASLCAKLSMPASRGRLALRADIDGARRILADQHGGEARARGRLLARSRRRRRATRSRSAAAAALPSISRRGHPPMIRLRRRRRRAASGAPGSRIRTTSGEKSIPPKSGSMRRIGR